MGKTSQNQNPNSRSSAFEDSFNAAKKQAYFILSHRDRTSFEISRKLREKRFSETTIIKTVSYLKEIGLLDDISFVQKWGRIRLDHYCFGPIRLRKEFLSKGLSPDIVDSFINTLSGKWDPDRLAENALLRRYKNPDALQTPAGRRRAFDFLQRKGHATEPILSAFKMIGLR